MYASKHSENFNKSRSITLFCQEMDTSLCQRPMKVWEFQSAFRWSSASLDSLLHGKKWMVPFGEYFDRFDDLVRSQDRDVLDSPVPIELSHAAAALCDDLVFTISDTGNVRRQEPNDISEITVSAVHIHDHFGGAVIEEVLEKGSYRLPEALWKPRAEQGVGGQPATPPRVGD